MCAETDHGKSAGENKRSPGTVSEGAAGHLFLPGTVLQCDPALRFKSCDGGFAGHSGIPGKLQKTFVGQGSAATGCPVADCVRSRVSGHAKSAYLHSAESGSSFLAYLYQGVTV